MVMNKKEQLFGVVERKEENKDYTGGSTSTATVTVDNQNRVITADVEFYKILGFDADKAYPGNLGVETREIALESQKIVKAETERAKAAEKAITEIIDLEVRELEGDDDILERNLNIEIVRASVAEQQLEARITTLTEEVSQNYVDLSTDIKTSVEEVKTDLHETDVKLQKSIQATEEKLRQKINGAQDNLNNKIVLASQKLEKKLDNQVTALEESNSETKGELKSDINILEGELSEKILKTQSTLTNSLLSVSEIFDSKLKNLSYKVDTKEEKLSQRINKLSDKVTDDISNLRDDTQEQINDIKENYAEKTYVYDTVVNMTKLTKQLVDEVIVSINMVVVDGKMTTPVEGVLYLVKDDSISVSDIYREYTLIDGRLTLIGDTQISLEGYATESFVEKRAVKIEDSLKDYAKLTDIPDVSSFLEQIPEEYITETELENKDYVTDLELQAKQYVTQDVLKDYAKKEDVPGLDDFKPDIPEEYITEDELEAKGYVTSEELENKQYVTASDLEHVETTLATISSNYVSKKELSDQGFITQDALEDYAKLTDIPDVSSFIDEIPEEYITETELNSVLEDYVKTSDLPDTPGSGGSSSVDEEQVQGIAESVFTQMLNNLKFIDGGTSSTISI